MREPIIPPGGADRIEPSHPTTARPRGARICGMVDGTTFCTLRVWTEAEWAALPEGDRPGRHAHFPAIGWVGADPIAEMN